jgi:hypothetical protein
MAGGGTTQIPASVVVRPSLERSRSEVRNCGATSVALAISASDRMPMTRPPDSTTGRRRTCSARMIDSARAIESSGPHATRLSDITSETKMAFGAPPPRPRCHANVTSCDHAGNRCPVLAGSAPQSQSHMSWAATASVWPSRTEPGLRVIRCSTFIGVSFLARKRRACRLRAVLKLCLPRVQALHRCSMVVCRWLGRPAQERATQLRRNVAQLPFTDGKGIALVCRHKGAPLLRVPSRKLRQASCSAVV